MIMKNREDFIQLPEDRVISCTICHKTLYKKHFIYKNVYKDGKSGICRYCDWMKRHHNNIPIIEGWNDHEIEQLINFILMDDSTCLNDAVHLFDAKTLKDLCYAFKKLHIGNKIMRVKTHCEYCGKVMEEFPNVYLKNHNTYCSQGCYYQDKTNKMLKGKDSPWYNRITTHCTFCGKEINVIPYNYNQTNEFGDNFNFCSHQCYHSFRSLYYVGEKCLLMAKR